MHSRREFTPSKKEAEKPAARFGDGKFGGGFNQSVEVVSGRSAM